MKELDKIKNRIHSNYGRGRAKSADFGRYNNKSRSLWTTYIDEC